MGNGAAAMYIFKVTNKPAQVHEIDLGALYNIPEAVKTYIQKKH
ncbi:MAG: hypothetical protein U9532_03175 ['Conium maculatum' witches'-broom phytoplasma]|nr:hypothetical protein ['Conium maculatum' witches'-broom phytoplasma]